MTGLTNCNSLEIIISVTKSATLGFRVYPHYHGGYINLGRAKDRDGLMRKLLYYSDQNFCFRGRMTPQMSSLDTRSRLNRAFPAMR